MGHSVCPWWLGYFLINPLRRISHNPQEILRDHVAEGMTVLDIGCGMGYFTLPLARLVGENGSVLAVDLQERMIKALLRRAEKAGLAARLQGRTCTVNSLGLAGYDGKIDFALAFAVVHEIPDKDRLFREIFAALGDGGRLLLAEPRGHVPQDEFAATLATAEACGFTVVTRPLVSRSHSALLAK